MFIPVPSSQLSSPSSPTIPGTQAGSPRCQRSSTEPQIPSVLPKTLAGERARGAVGAAPTTARRFGSSWCLEVRYPASKIKKKINHPLFSMAVPAAKITAEY